MGGLREEIFGGNVRACTTRASGGAVETSGGDDSEFTGSQTVKKKTESSILHVHIPRLRSTHLHQTKSATFCRRSA